MPINPLNNIGNGTSPGPYESGFNRTSEAIMQGIRQASPMAPAPLMINFYGTRNVYEASKLRIVNNIIKVKCDNAYFVITEKGPHFTISLLKGPDGPAMSGMSRTWRTNAPLAIGTSSSDIQGMKRCLGNLLPACGFAVRREDDMVIIEQLQARELKVTLEQKKVPAMSDTAISENAKILHGMALRELEKGKEDVSFNVASDGTVLVGETENDHYVVLARYSEKYGTLALANPSDIQPAMRRTINAIIAEVSNKLIWSPETVDESAALPGDPVIESLKPEEDEDASPAVKSVPLITTEDGPKAEDAIFPVYQKRSASITKDLGLSFVSSHAGTITLSQGNILRIYCRGRCFIVKQADEGGFSVGLRGAPAISIPLKEHGKIRIGSDTLPKSVREQIQRAAQSPFPPVAFTLTSSEERKLKVTKARKATFSGLFLLVTATQHDKEDKEDGND